MKTSDDSTGVACPAPPLGPDTGLMQLAVRFIASPDAPRHDQIDAIAGTERVEKFG